MNRLAPQPWMSDPAAAAVLDALEAEGGEDCARFVGGCVRNAVIGVEVADVDLATKLTPNRVLAALERAGVRAVPTGLVHGTVTAVSGGAPFEITTLRRDVETDGRNATVAFAEDWAEDAARRDFRLNALYADREGRLYDPVGGGIDDALAGRIVFVGDPETRVREDYLRILRFFRFYAWYGRAEPDAAALEACARLKDGLSRLSAERVAKELLRLFEAPDPRAAVRLARETGVLERVLPTAVDFARFEGLVPLDGDPLLRLSALLPDDPEAADSTARELRLSNAQAERLIAAAEGGIDLDMDGRAARVLVYREGAQAFADRVLKAWALEPDKAVRGQALVTAARGWTAPKFPLGGADVAALGVAPGPATGRLLRSAEQWWIEQDFPSAEAARARLAELAAELA